MEATALVALTGFPSSIVETILQKLCSKELGHLAFEFEVETEIVQISRQLITISSVIQEEEQKSASEEEARIRLIKVLFDVEDLLEELELEALNKVRDSSFHAASYRSLFGNRNFTLRFRDLSKKLEEFHGDVRPVVTLRQGGRARLELTPKPCSFLGRDVNDLKTMVEGSSQNAQEQVSIIYVVGDGGLGKTTLVEHVYNHKDIQNHFNLMMWVSVCASWVENSIDDGIIESISCKEHSKLTNMKLAQVNLQEILKGKKFLLVLDDVRDEQFEEWDQFFFNLLAGEQMGSKLLITTRNSDVANVRRYDLDPLSAGDSWHLFKYYFDGNHEFDNTKLKEVGRKIVELIGGFPQAIKTIASLLSQKMDAGFWKKILETFQQQRGGNNDNYDTTEFAMKITFQHLPPDLKQCLVHCSLFPRGYNLVKANIIHSWVAGGFILPHEEKKLEYIASKYFDNLLSMSFFRSLGDRYILHGSVHELASNVLLVRSCSRYNWLQEIPTSAIHLSLFSENLRPSELKDLKNFSLLRSLIFLHGNKSSFDHLTEDLLLGLKSLRILDMSHTGIKELPNSVGELKHLRFLNLSYTEIRGLPETLNRLYKLEVLDILECHMIITLPAWLKKMTSLRYLKASPGLIRTLGGTKDLAFLQSLEEFDVHKKLEKQLQARLRAQNIGTIYISLHQHPPLGQKLILVKALRNQGYVESWIIEYRQQVNVLQEYPVWRWSLPPARPIQSEFSSSIPDGKIKVSLSILKSWTSVQSQSGASVSFILTEYSSEQPPPMLNNWNCDNNDDQCSGADSHPEELEQSFYTSGGTKNLAVFQGLELESLVHKRSRHNVMDLEHGWHNVMDFGHGWHNAMDFGHGWHNAMDFGHGWHNAMDFGHGWHNAQPRLMMPTNLQLEVKTLTLVLGSEASNSSIMLVTFLPIVRILKRSRDIFRYKTSKVQLRSKLQYRGRRKLSSRGRSAPQDIKSVSDEKDAGVANLISKPHLKKSMEPERSNHHQDDIKLRPQQGESTSLSQRFNNLFSLLNFITILAVILIVNFYIRFNTSKSV